MEGVALDQKEDGPVRRVGVKYRDTLSGWGQRSDGEPGHPDALTRLGCEDCE